MNCDWYWNGEMSPLGAKIWLCLKCGEKHIKKNLSSSNRKPNKKECGVGEFFHFGVDAWEETVCKISVKLPITFIAEDEHGNTKEYTTKKDYDPSLIANVITWEDLVPIDGEE